MADAKEERPGTGGGNKATVRYHDESDGTYSMSEAAHMRYWDTDLLSWQRVTGSGGAIDTSGGGGGGGGTVAVHGIQALDQNDGATLMDVFALNNGLVVMPGDVFNIRFDDPPPIPPSVSMFNQQFDTPGQFISSGSSDGSKKLIIFDFAVGSASDASFTVSRLAGIASDIPLKGYMNRIDQSDDGEAVSISTPVTESGAYLVDDFGFNINITLDAITSGFAYVTFTGMTGAPYLPLPTP